MQLLFLINEINDLGQFQKNISPKMGPKMWTDVQTNSRIELPPKFHNSLVRCM